MILSGAPVNPIEIEDDTAGSSGYGRCLAAVWDNGAWKTGGQPRPAVNSEVLRWKSREGPALNCWAGRDRAGSTSADPTETFTSSSPANRPPGRRVNGVEVTPDTGTSRDCGAVHVLACSPPL